MSMHKKPVVKLVDTSGTIRLDLNDRRVHMTREQAREAIVELAKALDDGQHDIIHAFCSAYEPDTISVSKQGPSVGVFVEDRKQSNGESVHLSPPDAIRVALAMLSFAGEINGD